MAEQTLIPLSGAQFEISAGDYRAVITELGAGLRGLEYQGQPAVTGYDPDQLPPAGAGQLLLPWPNRLDGGRYAFAGASYQLDLNEPARGNAIHGLTRWASWQATAQAPDVAQLGLNLCGRPGYPFCLELSARYQLAERSGLTVTIIARNAGHRPAPYAAGSHPYLTAGSTVIDGCELTLPASRWLAADDRGIPRGPADRRYPAGSRADRAGQGLRRPRLGMAGRPGQAGGAVGRRRLPVAAGLHRRRAGRRRAPAGPGDRADDRAAERVRLRH